MQLQGNRIMWQLSALLAFSVVHTQDSCPRCFAFSISHSFIPASAFSVFLHSPPLLPSPLPLCRMLHACTDTYTHACLAKWGTRASSWGSALWPGLDNAALAPYTAIDEANNSGRVWLVNLLGWCNHTKTKKEHVRDMLYIHICKLYICICYMFLISMACWEEGFLGNSLAEMKNLEPQHSWHMQLYKVLSIVYNRYILYVLDQYGLLKRRLSRHSLAEI